MVETNIMNCPKCKAEMELVQIGGIEIDRCTRCKGIWFDQQEQSLIKSARGSHKADTGHGAIGEIITRSVTFSVPVVMSPCRKVNLNGDGC